MSSDVHPLPKYLLVVEIRREAMVNLKILAQEFGRTVVV